MNNEIFLDCLKHYQADFKFGETWQSLSIKYGFENAETLRQSFKNERKRRGIPSKKDNILIQKIPSMEYKEKRHNCKILLLDIETSPLLAFTWGLYDQNISYENVVQDWHLLCWSAKWLFDANMISDCLSSTEAKNHDDLRISKSMWELLNEADFIIAQNGNSFDLKKLNSRFIKHGLIPPSSYQSVDTLLAARNGFGFTSNKLDDLCTFFGFNNKTKTDFSLWKNCFYGDKESLNQMSSYCENDVLLLEEIYLKLRPWIKGHPNLNLWSEENISVCPNCGGKIEFKGNYYTPLNRYDAFRCIECGAIGRSKKNNLDKEKSKTIVR